MYIDVNLGKTGIVLKSMAKTCSTASLVILITHIVIIPDCIQRLYTVGQTCYQSFSHFFLLFERTELSTKCGSLLEGARARAICVVAYGSTVAISTLMSPI